MSAPLRGQPATGGGYLGPLLLALLFLGAALWLMLRQPESERSYPPYSTISPRRDGCKALYDLLEASGRQPQRFGEPQYDYPAKACMVAMLSSQEDMSAVFGGGLDAKAMRLWLEAGGRLVLGCENDYSKVPTDLLAELAPDETTPPAGQALTYSSERRLLAVRERDGEPGKISALSRVYQPGGIYKLKAERPPLWQAVKQLEFADRMPTDQLPCEILLSCYDPKSSAPQLAPLLLYRKCGKGELFILTRPEMLTNAWLGRADNHKLLLSLLDYASQGKGVYFDEHLHGLQQGGSNALSLLFHSLGGKLMLTFIGLIAVFWFGQALRPARFGASPLPPRRQASEMVLAQADLFRRANARHSVADALVDTLRRAQMEALHSHALPSGAELSDWAHRQRQALEPRQQKAVDPLLAYLDTRILPRSGGELAALASACDLLRGRLSAGLG